MLWSSGQILTNFSRCRLCLFIRCVDLTLALSGFWVRVLLNFIWSFGIPLTISVVFEFVVFGCVLRCVAVPFSGSHLKCAGLTSQGRPFPPCLLSGFSWLCRTIRWPCMGRPKGPSEAVQLRFFAKIHVSMCRFPYIRKCFSEFVARWAQTETRHGYAYLIIIVI